VKTKSEIILLVNYIAIHFNKFDAQLGK